MDNKNVWLVIIVVAIVGVLAYGGYQVYSNYAAINAATKTS